MEFLEHTLPNGLEIVAECNPQAHSAALGFFVRTGSRDEVPELSGVSHFLEHMMFKGTVRGGRTAADVNRELDEIGSQSNAYTSEEQTVYHTTFLPEYQERAIDLLADIMRPTLTPADFETEKKVILEEIAKYDDQPPFGAFEMAMEAHFGAHPLGQSVLGTPESVGKLQPEQMREYFQQRYSPRNICLAAAGKLDFDALVRQVTAFCGDWEPFEAVRDTSPPTAQNGFRIRQHPLANQQYVLRIFDGPACDDPRRYAARLAYTIVGDDSGSRLFWELIDPGLAEYAALGSHEFEGAGMVLGYLCGAAEATAENLGRMQQVLDEALAQGVTEEELQRACNKVASQIVLGSERPASRMGVVGNHWLQRRSYTTVRQELDCYRAVTVEDINAVLRDFPLSGGSTVAVGSLESLAPVERFES